MMSKNTQDDEAYDDNLDSDYKAVDGAAPGSDQHLLTKRQMTKNFLRLAVPSVITNLFNFSVLTVNFMFAGHYEHDSASKLAAIGLGGTVIAMLCRHIVTGINSAQETLVS